MIINELLDKFKEECGIFGIFSNTEIELSNILYVALSSLQHRGQESCGIAFSDGNKLKCFKDMGLVSEVFSKEKFRDVNGICCIGHVRYSTYGDSTIDNAQPILDEEKSYNIAIAHNGNLINSDKYKNKLLEKGVNFKTSTDSEVLIKMLQNDEKDIVESINDIMKKIKGGYSVLISEKNRIIGFRDPFGIRPLCIGKLNDSYILSSESCALDMIGADFIRDVKPGEIIVLDKNGLTSIVSDENNKCMTCAFEYIYFAREDSIIDGVYVSECRILSGIGAYKEHPVDADIVIGVPDSGILSAIGYSKASGIEYNLGFVKNKYIGRTFITPCNKKRKNNLFIKLNVIKKNIEGKKVVVLDDSIVRGNTSKRIVKSLKDAGAKEVHFIVASPIITSPCYLGIDTKNKKELIGSSRDIDEIRKFIGADSIGYLSINGFLETLKGKKDVCMKCFGK